MEHKFEFSSATDSSPMSINLNCRVVFFSYCECSVSHVCLLINRPEVGGQKIGANSIHVENI